MSTEPLDLDAARALIADLKDACEGTRRGESSDWLKLSVDVARIAPDLLAEIDRLRADIESLGHWDCPNCDGCEATDIDDDGSAMCARCGHQIDWIEPDTLTNAKAYADTLRVAKNRAFEEIERLRSAVTAEMNAVGFPSNGDPVQDVLTLITELYRGDEDKVRAAIAAHAQLKAVSDGS